IHPYQIRMDRNCERHHMPHEIHKSGVRAALEPRREPYWAAPLSSGRYLGVRKLQKGKCMWIARMYDEADGVHRYRSLGQVSKQNDFDKAVAAAEAWFADRSVGVTDKPPTVADACREYVAG